MGDSSDEDVPFAVRRAGILLGGAGGAAPGRPRNPTLLDSPDGGGASPLPSWVQDHKSPGDPLARALAAGGTSSSDDGGRPGAAKAVTSPAKAPPPPAAPAAEAAAAEATQPDAAGPSQPPPPKKRTPATGRKAAAAGALGAPAPLPAAAGAAAAAAAGARSSVPVVLPDKLSTIKVLLELESRGAGQGDVHGATDLSGDSGAIGRLVVLPPAAPGGAPRLQVDLKGVLYDAAVVPAPCTLGVLAIGGAEARVECLLDEFVQLREDTRFADADADAGGGARFALGDDDEDDHYGGGGDGGDDGGDGGGGGGKAKKGRKAAAGGGGGGGGARKGGGRKPAGAPKRAAGGVKKKPAAKKKAAPRKPKAK